MSISILKTFLVISFLGLMACGQVKTTAESQNPSKSQSDTVASEPQPQPNDDSAKEGTAPDSQDQPFSSVSKNNNSSQPINVPVVAPAPQAQDIPDSSVKINPPPPEKSEVQTQTSILGLGSAGQDVSALLDQGYTAAIFEARVCSITGEFSDHSQCFIVFKDGHSEKVNPSNRDLILPFITELQVASVSKSEPKAKKKRHHHFLFF